MFDSASLKDFCGRYPQATLLFILCSPLLLFFTAFAQRAVDEEMQPSSMMYFYVSSVFETLVVVKLASSVWCEDEKPESKTTGGYAYPLKEVQLITLRTLFPRNSIKNSVTKKHITCVVLAVAFELIAVIAGLELYGTTGRGPQADLIVISLDHPQYAITVGSQNQEHSQFGLVLFGICQFIGCLFLVNKLFVIIDPRLGGKAVYAAAFAVLILLGGRANGHLSPGMQGIQSLSMTAWRLATRVTPPLHDLYQADPSKYLYDNSRPKVNVLIMMNESINRRLIFGPQGKAMVPNLHQFLEEQGAGGNIYDFPYATSQSATTEVSINSFAQGIYPTDPDVGSRPNPSMYYYAKENCFNTTALYSAHTLSYGNMDTFLIDTNNIDVARHRGGLNAQVVLDFCMDDRELLQYFKKDIGVDKSQFKPVHGFSHPPPDVDLLTNYQEDDSEINRTLGEPWFAMFHSCGTHLPGYEEVGDTPSDDRWFNSIWRWDAVFGELLTSINLENTVLVLTSDHGHNFDDARKFARSWSFRNGDLHVPFIIYIPPALSKKHPNFKNVLEQNVYRSVTPIDIYPTVTSILRAASMCPHDSRMETKYKKIDGVDLTSVDAGGRRHVLSTNTGVLRYWSTSPFALTQDHMQLIWDDQRKHFLLFDVVDFTGEDVWPSLSISQQQHWIRKAKSHPQFLEILMKAGATFQ